MARGLRLFSLTPMALLMVSASTISNTVSLTQLSPSVSSPVVLTPMAATAQATSATLLPLVSLLLSLIH
ncbi:MAG: hypothetical protein EBR79_02115, partial [Proteobacteria bacterium]|nr:hypothetical protein [Pseudomonadota bacterium]